jgi:predicted NBD/HSP70 family sugar kinase
MPVPLAVPPLRERAARAAAEPTLWGMGAVVRHSVVHLAALDGRGRPLRDDRVDLHGGTEGLEPVWATIADAATALTAEASESGATVAGLTVVLPGLVDADRGLLHDPVAGRGPVAATAQLTRRLGASLPRIRLASHGLLAAVVEVGAGGAAADGILCYLSADHDVDFGLVAHGRPVTGATGLAGQVGHLPLDPLGHECSCGRRGCWATVISLPALLRRAADPDDPVRDPTLDVDAQVAEIERRARLDDGRTRRALAETGHALGLGVATLSQVLDADVVVLGGHLGRFLPYLLPAYESARRHHGVNRCRIEASHLDEVDLVYGAAAAALVLADPVGQDAEGPARAKGG